MALINNQFHLEGSKAYFTGFDYMFLQSRINTENYIREIERAFKILLLSKNNVVCPASHLYTPIMFDYLIKRPGILENKLIVPVLRNSVSDPNEFLDNYERGTSIKVDTGKRKDIISYYEKYLPTGVKWESTETIDLFTDCLLQALKNNKSVLHSNFRNLDSYYINKLISEIEYSGKTNRYILYKSTRRWDNFNKKIFRNYINLIYHRIGANLIDLECSLPITSYIDYSINKLTNSNILLSEREIFLKLLFERLFSIIELKPIGSDSLDNLSFYDINLIKQKLNESSFTEQYDILLNTTINSLNSDKNDLSFQSIEKPISILQKLSSTFDSIANEQALAARKKQNNQYLLSNTTSFFLDGVGFIPVLGNIVSATKMALTAPDIIFNLFYLIKNRKALESTKVVNELKDRKIKLLVKKFKINDKTYFLRYNKIDK